MSAACIACALRDERTQTRDDPSMGLTGVGGGVFVCPACHQRYQRTDDLAEDYNGPYDREYDYYEFRKLTPILPRPPVDGRTTAPAPPEVEETTPYRCPKCRSVETELDFSKSVFENKYIVCTACGYHSYITWDDQDEWLIVEQDRADRRARQTVEDGSVAPSTVATVAPAPAPVEPVAPAPARAPLGCARCAGDDAAGAWRAFERNHVASLVDEVHFGIDVKRCACGRHVVVVFAERVDYRDGDDSQTWLGLPVSADELSRLRAAPRPELSPLLNQLGHERRFLMRASWTADRWWCEGGFAIPPHD